MLIRKHSLKIGSIAAALALGACAQGSGGSAGEPAPFVEQVRILEKNNTAVGGDVTEAALAYVADQYDLIGGLSGGDDFAVKSKSVSKDGHQHIRMNQTFDGIKVHGADIVVHTSSSSFQALNGTLVKQLEGFDTNPEIKDLDAMAIAKADYETLAKDGASISALAYDREEVELVVLPMDGRDAALAYHVKFFTELQEDIKPGLWNYFIDAKNGEILKSFNGIHTLSQGSGPGGNAKFSFQWIDELDVEPSGSQFEMRTARLETRDMNNSQSGSGTIVTGPLSAVGDAPENDAHGYAEATLNYMQEWYGLDSINNNGFVIKSRVHYGSNYENAFWDGSQMTYGDGQNTFHPLSGDPDVVAHEINHGTTTFHSDLTYSGQSGGINESFSDVAGIIVAFYLSGDEQADGSGGDFLIGAKIFKDPDPNKALRYACNPPQDGSSIGHADDYTSGMDVHYSSGVFNKAFCLASKRLSSGDINAGVDTLATQAGVRRAGEAWYSANRNQWTSSTNFTQGCQGIMDATTALGFTQDERDIINKSFADVGVFCDGATQPIACDVTLTDETGTLTSPNYPENYPNNANTTICVQPASGQPATLTFDAFDTESNYDFVRVRDANGAELSNTSGTTAPADATSTLIAVTFTSDGSVTRAGFSASYSTGQVSNEPPAVAIDSPADGATVSDTVTVSASASDSDGTVARVTFTLPDGTSVEDTTSPFSVDWDSTAVANGDYSISAVATDDLGADSARFSIGISVNNGGGGGCIDGTFDATGLPLSIPDNNSTGITSSLSVPGAGTIESVSVSLDITHTWRGDLRVNLVSPDGTSVNLHNGTGSSADNLVITDFEVPSLVGEQGGGTWQLVVSDNASRDTGDLQSWSVTVRGGCGGGGNPGDWSGSDSPNMATVDNGVACTSLTVSDSGNAADVKLSLAGNHAWRSILRGTLEHNGTEVEAFATGTFSSNAGSFSLTDQAVAGFSGDAAGEWTLCIHDTDAFGDSGVLDTWSVKN